VHLSFQSIDDSALAGLGGATSSPDIAVFPVLADAVDVKRGDQLCETVSQPSTLPDKVVRPMGSWPRPGLDFDHIGQNWEGSNKSRTNNVPRARNMGPRVPRGPTWRSMWKNAA